MGSRAAFAGPRPRVLSIDLDRLERGELGLRPEPWRSGDPSVDRVGALAGSALAVALIRDRVRERPDAEVPLVLAVGSAVRRGLSTAARATVASRAPLTGLFADGQVGSDLGRRLASLTDALVLAGRTSVPGAVLSLTEGSGAGEVRAELVSLPELAGRGPSEVAEVLEQRLGRAAVLCIGRAGERGLPFASLAAGSDPPSFVGRGGLGAVLGRLGLKAVAVGAPPVLPQDSASSRELARLLAGSPRLLARASGGTLELAPARAALGLHGPERGPSYEVARAFAADAERGTVGRKGCKGCPTPCGWVFERTHPSDLEPGARDSGRRLGARFSALDALGFGLGLERFEDALALLARCDEAGVDAKEVGAVLALLCTAREHGLLPGPTPRGDRAALGAALEDLVEGRGDGRLLARGSLGLAQALGLEAEVAKGSAVQRGLGLAELLGQCVSSRGSDPMRTFPFLAGGGVDRARLEGLLAPLSVPEGALDPRDPAGKGRIVFWHENLMAAVDATGFCAFSAAGLLADGLCDVDRLAEWTAPELGGRSPGRELLAAGASIVLLQRELDVHWGAGQGADLPEWARAELLKPGMWEEYRRLRGLDPDGRPTEEARARIGTEAVLDLPERSDHLPDLRDPKRTAPAPAGAPRARSPGRVEVRAFGPLERALGAAPGSAAGSPAQFELDLPASVVELLEHVARERPGARAWLLREGVPVPAVLRSGEALSAREHVRDGDRLDLVLAIAGGAA